MRPELLDPEFLIAYLRDHTKFDANLVENIINEWKAYKATGLEPEEIKLMQEREEWQPMAKITQMCGVPIDRICELAEADKDGRCVVLPCKVGAKLYTLFGVTVMEHTARRFSFQRTQSDADMKLYIHTNYGMIFAETIGKTVFLTREAAEAALKGE